MYESEQLNRLDELIEEALSVRAYMTSLYSKGMVDRYMAEQNELTKVRTEIQEILNELDRKLSQPQKENDPPNEN